MALIKPFRGKLLPGGVCRVDGVFCEEDDSHWEFAVNAACRLNVYFEPQRVITGNGIRTATD